MHRFVKMKYLEGRDLIKNGDIILVTRPKNSFSLFASTISFLMQSQIYHSAIAVWLKAETGEQRLFVVEADINNRRVVPLSFYEDRELHVLACPEEIKFRYFSSEMIEKVGSAKYSILKAIEAGFRKYFLLPRLATNGEICSEFCIRMWRMGSFNWDETNLITPDMLEKKLLQLGIKYRCIINE